MAEVKKVFVTGGARSGKSRFAQSAAQALGARRVFVATAEALDEEMAQRIARHKAERDASWSTCEAPYDLCEALREHAARADVLLVDCLTLWISNLLLHRGHGAVGPAVEDLARTITDIKSCHLVIVSNEVGAGIVPENALAREYRDLTGTANQRVAAACTEVFLIAAGLPLALMRNGAPCGYPPWMQG